ncbi:hypothetical protein JNUCC74_18140 [Cerasibacillus sp. JNUCC 74]
MEENNYSTYRSTRLAFTITIFGGAWFITKGGTKLWSKIFSEIAYTKTLYNFEHLYAIIIMTIIIVIVISVIKYIYYEMKSYALYRKPKHQADVFKKADDCFENIFRNLEYSLKIIILPLLVLLLIKGIKENINLTKWLLGGCSIIIIIIIFIMHLNKKVRNKFIKITHSFERKIDKSVPFALFGYFALLIATLGITVTLLSLDQGKYAIVRFNDTQQMPLEIKVNNYDDVKFQLRIIRDSVFNKHININVKEMERYSSSIEVFKSDNNKLNMDIEEFKSRLDKNNYGVSIQKSNNIDNYKLNLDKYILDGKNTIELLIQTTNENIFIVNELYKSGDEIRIKEKEFEVKF